MTKADIYIDFVDDRPYVKFSNCFFDKALIDTGASLPVLNMYVSEINKFAQRADDNIWTLGGFGIIKQPCYLYKIPKWTFGKATFIDLPCLVPVVPKNDIASFIIPASIFRETIYCFDTINNNLKILYPDDYDPIRTLDASYSNGKVHVFTCGNTAFRTLTGSAEVKYYIGGKLEHTAIYTDCTLSEIFFEIELCKKNLVEDITEVTAKIVRSSFKDLEELEYF